MSPTPTKVCGYVRGSTEEQQHTLVAQEHTIRAYCAFKGLDCARVFIDSGESGTTTFYQRPAAAGMIAWMLENGVSGVVFPKLDRGFRDALDCLFTIDDLGRKGMHLHILDIQLDTASPVGKLVLTLMAAIAEFENKRRSERQRAAFAVMRQQGRTCGQAPFGWDDVHGQLVENADEQPVRARLLTGDLSGLSLNAAARRLNQEGIPTKKGGKWFGATVASIKATAAAQQPAV